MVTAEGDIVAVWRDRDVIPRNAPTYTVDLSAADGLPGRPVVVSDAYLVTGEGQPNTTESFVMKVYRLTT